MFFGCFIMLENVSAIVDKKEDKAIIFMGDINFEFYKKTTAMDKDTNHYSGNYYL